MTEPALVCALVALPLLAAAALAWLDWTTAIVAIVAALLAACVTSWRWQRGVSAVTRWLADRASQGDSDTSFPQISTAIEDDLGQLKNMARRSYRLSGYLRAYRDLIDRLADSLPDPVLFVDNELNIDRCNEPAKRAFDLDNLPTPLGRAIRDPELLSAVQSVAQSRQSAQLEFQRPQMPEVRYSARLEPIDIGDHLQGVVMAIREESETLSIERVRSDFIANVSHELRTPLTAMTGIVETLQTTAKGDADATEMFLTIMADETRRMRRLVDDLLTLARIESEDELADERCDLTEIVRQSASLVRDTLNRAEIDLQIDVDDADMEFFGDGDQIAQVLQNLLENAVKYGGPGKRIWLSAKRLEPAPSSAGTLAGRPVIHVAVRDEGPGIEERHLSRLTERFFRVDKARSRASGGTGLGLAIVKHIVKRHRAHLAISSQIGKGSEFSLFLPI